MSIDPNSSASSSSRVRVSDMEQESSIWDWGDLLDFSIDDADPLILPWDGSDQLQEQQPPPPPPPPPPPLEEEERSPAQGSAGRVRKRDPRLVCENFLAGRVPCACPEVDEMMLREEEEEEAEATIGGRKRVRVRAAAAASTARCQVPGCEVDIRELKGYHRRHRVCLRCANATSVVIDGEEKRYCQQCGKFHMLPDFDEGKRSCRRKLEKHNRRRRRRPTNLVSIVEIEKGPPADLSTEATCDEKQIEDNGFGCEKVLSSKINDREALLESDDGHGSPISSLPDSQNVQSNSIASVVPGDAQIDEEKDNSKSALSSTICENRGSYSSLCPTGRISFKLYDWNPAEFPRRLRHQIFQWLASMPVELEGYVRPGCTILTIFIAMPQFMWEKLSKDATLCIKDLINAPESLLLGRGNIFIFLSNMIIQVLKDGSSLANVRMEVKAPRIHYVHPTYFEAGKPMEFVVCGSSLNQPKFRFLVSFAGTYMVYDSCCAIYHGKVMPYEGNEEKSCHEPDHEMFRICISQTDSKIFGPAFVEVENDSGLSNFIPILIGNKHICSELERMQVALCGPLPESLGSQNSISNTNPALCEFLVARQLAESELLVDIAWLLKEPCREGNEAIFNSVNIQRLTSLLKISIQNELVNVLQVILNYLDATISTLGVQDTNGLIPEDDIKLLQRYVQRAKEILSQRVLPDARAEPDGSLRQEDLLPQNRASSAKIQGEEARNGDCLRSSIASTPQESDENIPLVGRAMVSRKHCYPCVRVNWHRESWRSSLLPHAVTGTRLAVFVMVSVVMCVGACIVLLHPQKPREIVVSLRRCLFGYTVL